MNAATLPVRGGRFHLVEPLVQVAEVGCDDVVHEDPLRAAVRQLLGQLLGPELIEERHRCVGRPGVRHVGEHRDGRVAREEEIVEVGRAARTFEAIRRAARRDHPEHQLHRVGRVLGPGPVRHHVMRMDVDDELVPAQRVLARLDVVRGRNREGTTGSRRRRTGGRRLRGRGRRFGPRDSPTSCMRRGRSWRGPPPRHPRFAGNGAGPFPRNRPRRRRGSSAAFATSSSWLVGGSGTYSPFVAGNTPRGSRTSPSGSSAPLRRVTFQQ